MSTETIEQVNTLDAPPGQPCNCPWDEACEQPGAWQQTCSQGHALILRGTTMSTWCEHHHDETERMYAENPAVADAVSRSVRVRCHVCREQIATPFIWVHL